MNKRSFFLLGLTESFLALIWLLLIPSSSQNSWILGLSKSRWGLLIGILIILIAFLGHFVTRKEKPTPFDHLIKRTTSNNYSYSSTIIILVVLFIINIVVTIMLAQFFWEGYLLYFQRLAPFYFLITLVHLQTIVHLTTNQEILNQLKLTKNKNSIQTEPDQLVSTTPKKFQPAILLIILIIFVTILTGPITRDIVDYKIEGPVPDVQYYIICAKDLANCGEVQFSHFMAALFMYLTSIIFSLSINDAAVVVLTLGHIAFCIMIYNYLKSNPFSKNIFKSSLAYILITITLLMISPINLFSWNIKNYYMGYIGMAFYSNPATVMIRPFALIIFLITAKILSDHPIKNKMSAVLSLGILNVIGILTKPTFAISFLPTVGLISLYKLIKKQSFKLSIIIFGIGIPSVLTLAWQYLLTYTGNWSNSRIIWAPFAVSQLPISAQLLRYIASIAFPLLVYFLYFQYTKNDFYLNFSWLILLVSTFLMFSLAESGDRFSHGNFFAAGNISLFILYIISTKVFLQENKDILYTLKPIKLVKFAGASSIYLMHFVSGIAFYLWHVFSLTIDLP